LSEKRSDSHLSNGLDISPRVKQHLHHLHMALGRREVQSGPVKACSDFDVWFFLEDCRHDLCGARGCRNVEGTEIICIPGLPVLLVTKVFSKLKGVLR
jgi:hypothetical protein